MTEIVQPIDPDDAPPMPDNDPVPTESGDNKEEEE